MKVTVDINSDCDTSWVPDELLCTRWILAAMNSIPFSRDSSVSLSFVDAKTSAELNSQYRGKNTATNVLSFPCEYPENLSSLIDHQPLGDIVICPTVVEQEAVQQTKELQSHWAHLLIHGVFHLLGYDHDLEADANKMEQLEITALQTLGIPNPYLIGC